MIDFSNSNFLKLRQVKTEDGVKAVGALLIDGETVLSVYKSVRDCVVFTDKRAISVNVQGMTGKKRDFTIMPYSKITSFSVETAGFFDLDCELTLWFSGLGKVTFEFLGECDIERIGKLIAAHCL